MVSDGIWSGSFFRKPSLKAAINIGLSCLIAIWVLLFSGGDIILRVSLCISVVIVALVLELLDWRSLLSWKGYKSFVFYVVAQGLEDAAVKDALSLFDDPGIKVSVSELPAEESAEFFAHRRDIYKHDIDSISSSGKAVPAHLLKSYEESSHLLLSVQERMALVYVISALFDTSKIGRRKAAQIIHKAQEICLV